ncbi:MAG: hypothetical protein ILO34_07245 [Kiritimatiellae bacterium]|nr:hypothetical protein [Kiritimatiellia bacterium]
MGLGNSGAVASAFLLLDIPEIRTMVNSHITLLAEYGWLAGWVWFAFIGMALSGIASSPRTGIAFAGLVLSACSSTVFDWPVLFDFADQGGFGMTNWVLSDVSEDATSGVEWWNPAIDFFRAGGRKFDFSKLKTFRDWKHGAK